MERNNLPNFRPGHLHVCLLILVLFGAVSILKMEGLFVGLYLQIPALLFGGLFIGSYYYYVSTVHHGRKPHRIVLNERQAKVSMWVLFFSAVVAEVLVKGWGVHLLYIQIWLLIWLFIGSEAVFELIKYLRDWNGKH